MAGCHRRAGITYLPSPHSDRPPTRPSGAAGARTGPTAHVCRLGPVAHHMGQRRFDDFPRMVGFLSRPVPEAGSETVRHGRDLQVLQEPRQPALSRMASRPGSRTRTGCGRRRASRAASRISAARSHSGTRCSRLDFMRTAGTVHTLAGRSISAHRAPRTSPERAAVSDSNVHGCSQKKQGAVSGSLGQ